MTKISIIQGDITEQKIDAIVNAANLYLMNGGGVDGAIHRAAGPGLTEECLSLGGCEIGSAKITQAYNLLARHIIHAVGPKYGWEKGREAELLRSCHEASLMLAKDHGCRTIAFPGISIGTHQYPVAEAANIAISAVRDFISEYPDVFDEVVFVLLDEVSYRVYFDSMAL